MSIINIKKLVIVLSVLLVAVFLFWLSFRYGFSSTQREDKVTQDVEIVNRESPIDSYTVKGGDHLESISQLFGLSKETIIFANALDPEEDLYSGQELLIPPTDGVLVVVEEEDTIESLAKEYEVETQAIADLNWLDYPFSLEAGTTIFIPLQF